MALIGSRPPPVDISTFMKLRVMLLHVKSGGNVTERQGNWLIGACCGLYIAVTVMPTQVYQNGWRLLSTEHAADWAQVVGTALSILAAGWFVSAQIAATRRLDVERRAADAIEANERSSRILRVSLERMRKILNVANKGFASGSYSEERIILLSRNITRVQNSFSTIDISRLNSMQFGIFSYIEAATETLILQLTYYKDEKSICAQMNEALEEQIAAIDEDIAKLDWAER